ncbi:MAG: protease modulator HflC [Burkholderiaceae bacterium]|jgi:membrane protease subunit HflC|nr:protease modulator HflC [Burkholderiaceae bacterium]
MHKIGFFVTTVLIALAVVASTAFVVDQRQFGVVYELGKPKRAITEPGLYWQAPPPFQKVGYLDKRLLTLTSGEGNAVPAPMLTAEKKRVVIDWYVRWRITDPLAYVRTMQGGNEAAGAAQLDRVVRNAFQEEVNRRTVQELISSKREEVMSNVKRAVDQAVKGDKPWGIDIVDVRLMRADYAESIINSVYDRMQNERKRVASEQRSKGAAEAEQIEADADRQSQITIANATRDAQKVKGEGDAQAARIYAEAFGKDPQFAAFYRSLDAYKDSLGKKGDVLVIDPANSEFFRALQGNAPAR